MHDELRRAGLRRVRIWTAVLLVVAALGGALLAVALAFEPDWPPVTGGFRTIAIGAVAGWVVTVLTLVLTSTDFARRAWPTVPVEPAPDLEWVAAGAALARGVPPPRVWRVRSGAPNVACVARRDGVHVVVSTAAEIGLTRDELEAVVALQLSLLLDRAATRVRRPLLAVARVITWSVWGGVAAAVVSTVRSPVFAGLTVNLAAWSCVGLVALLALVQRRLRWAWGIVGDAVALETTRHPEPLVRALRRLAGYNGPQVPVRRSWGAADPYWAVPVRRHVQVSTMVVNDRARSKSSTEQVSDAALLLRAGIVERVAVGGDPTTLATWQAARATFERLARYGATGAGDGTVDGVEVTTAGAGAGALPPVGGSWGAEATPGG